MEADIGRPARCNTNIHGAEEEVSAIADAELRVRIFGGKTNKTANVRNGYGACAYMIGGVGVIVDCHLGRWAGVKPIFVRFMVSIDCLLMRFHLLPTEQKCCVDTPINGKLCVFIACQLRGTFPGNRWSNAVEASGNTHIVVVAVKWLAYWDPQMIGIGRIGHVFVFEPPIGIFP